MEGGGREGQRVGGRKGLTTGICYNHNQDMESARFDLNVRECPEWLLERKRPI